MTSRTRLSPEQRRDQLLDLGVRLLAERSLDEISIDVLSTEGGVSRGLLYHYFGGKQGFREAVVRRAAADLIEQTTPPPGGDVVERLLLALTGYVDFVDANYEGYLSLVRGAASDPSLRALHDEVRTAISDLVYAEDADGIMPRTSEGRLLVRGWQAMAEELVLAWKAGETEVTREQLIDLLAGSLPALASRWSGSEARP